MPGAGRAAIGAIIGAVVAGLLAPLIRPFFSIPDGGVGFVTVHQYPKGWDYAVVALIVVLAFVGGVAALGRRRVPALRGDERTFRTWWMALLVFVLMLFVHDNPYALVDMFHEGERLTPAFVMREGGRPFGDIFLLHGLVTDGGLDALFMTDPPSPRSLRRMYTFLSAATIALLVPLAAQVCVTPLGAALGVVLSIAAMGAGQAIGFPYFRLAPLVIATLAFLRYVRTGRIGWLFAAFASSTLGLLWSLDTGAYSVAASVALTFLGLLAARRLPNRNEVIAGLVALVLPFIVLLIVNADIYHFLVDSFLIIPEANDAAGSLPAPKSISFESARYYGPLVFYGFLLALAWRAPDPLRRQIVIFVVFSLLLYRTAGGRVGWSHVRYAMPLLGIAVAAWAIEPLIRRRKPVAAALIAIPFLVVLEVGPNITDGFRALRRWPERQRHDGLVPYPIYGGKGIYTTADNAADLAALNGYIHEMGPEAQFLDFAGERALYYFLQRKPPLRCPDINMLSHPALFAEAMAQLNANPPEFVVISGHEPLRAFDGIPHEIRVPELAQWIESNYPVRYQIGRFEVAAKE